MNTSGDLRSALRQRSQTLNGESQAKPRVLIVDDELPVRTLLSDILSLDFECELASDGREAIERLGAERFDLVLSDMMMPNATGIDLLQYVTEQNITTPVVLVTAVQDARRAVEAIRLGAFDYILKPFEIDEVELCAERALTYKRIVDENRQYQLRLEALVVERTAHMREKQDRLESALLDLGLAFRVTLGMLTSAMETRNGKAVGHTERVTAYALRLARELELSRQQLHALETGALLHDIGLMTVPEQVLTKPGPLDTDDWGKIHEHTCQGAEWLRSAGVLVDATAIIEQHHEHWDGSGYPRKLVGEQIDIVARVFAVADCIEAMTTDRPYRQAMTFEEVAQELAKLSGAQFDPAVVEAFFKIPADEWTRLQSRELQRGISISAIAGAGFASD